MSENKCPNRNLDLCHRLVWNRYDDSREWVKGSIETHGWDRTREVLTDSMNCTFNEWFHINKTLLHIFKLTELLGYDGDVMDLLTDVGESTSYGEVRLELGELLGRKVSEQWERGGSTWFFDADLMLTSTSKDLIPQLLKARKEEFGYVVTLYNNTDRSSPELDVANKLYRELWNAWYGYRIHREVWSVARMEDLSTYYPKMLELNKELGNNPESTCREQGPIMSERLDDLLTCLWGISRFIAFNQFTERMVPTGIIEFPRMLEIEPVGNPPTYEIIPELNLSVIKREYESIFNVCALHLFKNSISYPPRLGLIWRYTTVEPHWTEDFRKKVYAAAIEEASMTDDGPYFLERDVSEAKTL